MRNRDEIAGKAKEIKGKLKKGAADVTGDERLRGEGDVEEAVGKGRQTLGKGRRKVGETLERAGRRVKR
jgi:uncharacterized protein YjbJ (UPF0337 family)